jgi:hypothetical protein
VARISFDFRNQECLLTLFTIIVSASEESFVFEMMIVFFQVTAVHSSVTLTVKRLSHFIEGFKCEAKFLHPKIRVQRRSPTKVHNLTASCAASTWRPSLIQRTNQKTSNDYS